MNKAIKGKFNGKKQKTLSLQQKIDAAQKKKAKMRAEAELAPITVSPAANMTTAYTVVGFILRTLVMFIGVFGMNLFFADAVKIVILNGAKADNIVLETGFLVLWSVLVTVITMALLARAESRA